MAANASCGPSGINDGGYVYDTINVLDVPLPPDAQDGSADTPTADLVTPDTINIIDVFAPDGADAATPDAVDAMPDSSSDGSPADGD